MSTEVFKITDLLREKYKAHVEPAADLFGVELIRSLPRESSVDKEHDVLLSIEFTVDPKTGRMLGQTKIFEIELKTSTQVLESRDRTKEYEKHSFVVDLTERIQADMRSSRPNIAKAATEQEKIEQRHSLEDDPAKVRRTRWGKH
ncbi:MAG: hypothetical protein WCC94_01345 [Candidatus Bathyarchaeia archaeon]